VFGPLGNPVTEFSNPKHYAPGLRVFHVFGEDARSSARSRQCFGSAIRDGIYAPFGARLARLSSLKDIS
jgi:hypothetical protein